MAQARKRRAVVRRARKKTVYRKKNWTYLTPETAEQFFKLSWANKRSVLYNVYAKLPQYRDKALRLDWYITEAHIGTPTIKRDPKLDREVDRLVDEWVRVVKKHLKGKRIPVTYGRNVAIIIPFKGKKFILWPTASILGPWVIDIDLYEHEWQLDRAHEVIGERRERAS